MLKSDLVDVLIAKAKITQRQAEEAVDHIFDVMKAALVRGEHIEIRGLGAFHVKQYKGYTGRNPKTSVVIEVKPKRGVLFRTGKDLRDRMNAAPSKGTEPRSKKSDPSSKNPTEHAA